MGDVFLAQHHVTGSLVALKRAREMDSAHISSLRREIYALSRLRHPGIVRLIEHGTSDGVPWCGLEVIDGQTMFALLEPPDVGPTRPAALTPTTATMVALEHTSPEGDGLVLLAGKRDRTPFPPPAPVAAKCLLALKKVCEALSFLHGEGVVHCDLKPANIVLRPDGFPVIIDFGLMVHASGPHGRERLDESWAAIGTFEYMAPERIRRELVDARADLYALGCMLYEVLTGRPPFIGEHGLILRQHVTQKPVLPSKLVPSVPKEMDEIVMRLLEKDPRDRIGYADSVAAALEAALAEMPVPSSGSASKKAYSGSQPRAYLYRPTFAGHAGALRQIVTEAHGLVLVGAESGAGKTRFALEVGRALAAEMRIVMGECLPIGTEGTAVFGAPLHPLATFLRAVVDECRSQGPGMTEMLLGRRGRVLADYEPSLLDLEEVSELPTPARLSPEAAQQRLYADLAETMFAFAQLQRFVLIVDDLQWADEVTLGFLRSIRPQTLADQGILLIGTYRTDEAGEALRSLAASADVRRVELPRLSQEAVGSIARDMLALSAAPTPLVEWLTQNSSGNPFFVAEYLRSTVEGGLLVRDVFGHWSAGPALGSADLRKLPVPGSVRDLLEMRLNGLSADARLWVLAAAVIGREIDLNLLERVARPTEGAAPDSNVAPSTGKNRFVAIEELLARQIFEEVPRGYRFVHDKLREAAYDRIPSEQRKALHLSTARAIEEVFTAPRTIPSTYAALAHHYGCAEMEDKTFRYLELAAENALRAGAYVQSHSFLTRLLSLDLAAGKKVTPLARAKFYRWLGEASYALGNLTEMGDHSAAGLRELGRPLPESALGWAVALTSELATQGRAVLEKRVPQWPWKSKTEAAAGEREAHTETSQMAAQLAFHYYFANDARGLITTSLIAVNAAETAAVESRGLSRAYAYLGYLTGLARLHPMAHQYFREAKSAGMGADDSDGVAFALMTEAVYRLGKCEWQVAETSAHEALAIQVENENAMEAELLHTIVGHIEYFTGRLEASRRRFEAMQQAAGRRHHEQHAAWGKYSVARCYIAEGRLEKARGMLREASQLLTSIADEASQLIVDGLSAEVHMRLGDVPSATMFAERIALRIDRTHVPTVFSTVHAYVALASVRLSLWEMFGPSGRIAALRACALLSAFAAMFPLGEPAAQRNNGIALWLLGFKTEALKQLEKAVKTANLRGMPYEEGLSLGELRRLRKA